MNREEASIFTGRRIEGLVIGDWRFPNSGPSPEHVFRVSDSVPSTWLTSLPKIPSAIILEDHDLKEIANTKTRPSAPAHGKAAPVTDEVLMSARISNPQSPITNHQSQINNGPGLGILKDYDPDKR